MSNNIFSTITASLNLVAFIYNNPNSFQHQGQMPDWMLYFCGTPKLNRHYDLLTLFPFLSCFIEDAEAQWNTKNTHPLSSGIWIEIDSLGHELALEALAFWGNDKPIFLIQNLGDKYQQDLQRLQQLRDGLLTQEKLEIEIKRRTLKIRQREEDIALKLVSLTSYRDEETGAHVRRIGLYAAAMAKNIGWSTDKVDDIRIAAPMHDLGKIGIPDRILLKAGKLTENEYSVMKRHTEIGAKMLEGSNIPLLDMAAEIALYHHERWDGTGYPRGLAGNDIPISARITAIVDIYDALVHERVYKKALSEKEALAMMQTMSGTHLDPVLLDVFFALLPVIRRIRNEVHELSDLMVCY